MRYLSGAPVVSLRILHFTMKKEATFLISGKGHILRIIKAASHDVLEGE
jgi:hypothetical protein